jgi:hypothetical protein
MRPTDVCHPNELRAPAPRVFPARSRHFRSGDTPRSLGLRTVVPGDRMVHAIRRTLRRIVIGRLNRVPASRPGTSVGVFFPRCRCDRASDTPVANPHCPSPLLPSQELQPWPCVLFWRFGTGRVVWSPPRPSPSSSREGRRRLMIQSAFRRQGLFTGSGGLYSPGPTTHAPLLAMGEPLDDDLSPS